MARINGSGFKMKRTPVKGLADFFSSLGKQLRGNSKNIGGETKKKYSGKAQRANEVPRPGESKYQFDVRTRKARSKKADKPVTKTPEQQAKIDPKSEVKIDPRVGMDRYTYTDAGDTKKVKTKFSGSGTDARKKQYDAKGWRYDDTIKGYNRDGTEKNKGKFRVQLMVGEGDQDAKTLRNMNKVGTVDRTQQGTEMYTYHSPDFKTQEEADTYLAKAKLSGFENAFTPSPIDKKSPTKKKGFKMPGYGKRK